MRLGIRFTVCPNVTLEDGIQAARVVLARIERPPVVHERFESRCQRVASNQHVPNSKRARRGPPLYT